MDQFKYLSMSPLDRAHYDASRSMQNAANCVAYSGYVNANSPEHLTREQLKTLLNWDKADANVTKEMMVIAVKNRLHLGRLSLEEIRSAA